MHEQRLAVLQLALQSMIDVAKKMELQILEYGPVTPEYYETLQDSEYALMLSGMTPEEFIKEFGVDLYKESKGRPNMGDVLSLFEARKSKEEAPEENPAKDHFEAVQKANKEREERLRTERVKHNRQVTRDYRLK